MAAKDVITDEIVDEMCAAWARAWPQSLRSPMEQTAHETVTNTMRAAVEGGLPSLITRLTELLNARLETARFEIGEQAEIGFCAAMDELERLTR